MGCRLVAIADVLPYFKRAEDNESGGDDYHGGERAAARLRRAPSTNLSRRFIEAGVEAGYRRTSDFNGYQQEGFGPYQLTMRERRRAGAPRPPICIRRCAGQT